MKGIISEFFVATDYIILGLGCIQLLQRTDVHQPDRWLHWLVSVR